MITVNSLTLSGDAYHHIMLYACLVLSRGAPGGFRPSVYSMTALYTQHLAPSF